MKYSIIVVSLNPGDRLYSTVKSILNQTYSDFEIVVKDGGSTDDSIEKLKTINDDRIKITISKDKSIYDAMNQAVELASGEYYLFLNCGDLFENDSVLENVASYTRTNEAIYYGDMRRADTKGVIPSSRKITDFVCYRNIPCHQTCFYRADMFEKRGYDLAFPVRADYEHFLWCRYENGASMIYVPVIVCLYEGAGFSETKDHERAANKEHKIITKKYLGGKCILYRIVMIVTLQPLRKIMAKTGFYQGIKRLIYGKAN